MTITFLPVGVCVLAFGLVKADKMAPQVISHNLFFGGRGRYFFFFLAFILFFFKLLLFSAWRLIGGRPRGIPGAHTRPSCVEISKKSRIGVLHVDYVCRCAT